MEIWKEKITRKSVYWFLYTCLLSFRTVYSQMAFDISLSITPQGIEPGMEVNMSCKFKLTALQYDNVRWSQGGGPLLYKYAQSVDVNNFGAAVTNSGLYLSNDANKESVQWLIYKPTPCNQSALAGPFKCTVYNGELEFSEATANLTFRAPKRRLTINGTEFCPSNSDGSEQWNFVKGDRVTITYSTEEERNAVQSLKITLDGQEYSSTSKSSKDCSHGATVSETYTVQDEDLAVSYELHLGSEIIKKTCTIGAPKFVTSGKSKGGLGGGSVGGIIVAVVAVVVLVVIGAFVVVKKKQKSGPTNL